jgi:hypothetical protein
VEGLKFPPESLQVMKAHRAGVEEEACIFKICDSKSRFYVTEEISRGFIFFLRISSFVRPGGEGICLCCELNPGPKIY